MDISDSLADYLEANQGYTKGTDLFYGRFPESVTNALMVNKLVDLYIHNHVYKADFQLFMRGNSSASTEETLMTLTRVLKNLDENAFPGVNKLNKILWEGGPVFADTEENIIDGLRIYDYMTRIALYYERTA